MVVVRPRIATVDIRIPTVIIHHGVSALVASASTWTLMHRDSGGHILFLDMIQRVHTIVLRRVVVGNCAVAVKGTLTSFTSCLARLISSGHGGMEGSEFAHHTLVLLLFISMHGLGMLTQVIETRKLF
jgi:hypothetical protein